MNLNLSNGFILTVLLAQIFYLCTLIAHLRRNDCSDTDKIIWTIILCLLNWVGAVLYLCIGPTPTKSEQAQPSAKSPYQTSNGDDCPSCGRILQLGTSICAYCGNRA